MGSTKSVLANIGEALGKMPSSFTFQDPPLIAVPYSTITQLNGSTRQMPDPSKTIRPALGRERITVKSISLVEDEKGPNGELIWEPASKDARVRYCGAWTSDNSGLGQHLITSLANNFAEISFYGTGLNLILFVDATSRDLRVTIDNGVESGNIYTTSSNVISNRSYASNIIINVATNLTLGHHTVKIRQQSGSTNFRIFGFEILNQSTQIKIPQGEIFSNGLKFANPALQSIDYNTGFDGSPVLNGKGGRVVTYLTSQGVTGKAIQQVDASALYGSSADHSNEEVLRIMNFREAGVGRTDDFVGLGDGVEDNAFTLSDGTTSLVGDSVRAFSNANFPINNLYINEINDTGVTFTFVGTGLDAIITFGSSPETINIKVDGVAVTTLTFDTLTQYKLKKIVSGLPFGSHTVSILRGGPLLSNFLAVHDLIIYGPKKPSIPSNAIQTGEYYLLSDFNYSNVTGLTSPANLIMPRGVISKGPLREIFYSGSWSVGGTSDIDNDHTHGLITSTTTASDYLEYTFWGTGIEAHLCTSATGTYVATIAIDGVNNASGTVSGNIVNSGAGAYTTNSTVIQQPARVVFTGLSLGLHKIRITRTSGAGSMNVDSLNVITPIYFPNVNESQSMGPAVQLKTSSSLSKVDMTKAKAWLVYDGVNQVIRDSFNIKAVVRLATGQYTAFFEKAFKNDRYSVVHGGWLDAFFISYGPVGAGASDARGMQRNSLTWTNATTSGAVQDSEITCLAFFGELQDEE